MQLNETVQSHEDNSFWKHHLNNHGQANGFSKRKFSVYYTWKGHESMFEEQTHVMEGKRLLGVFPQTYRSHMTQIHSQTVF